jgi:hypothetical protein
VGVAAAATADVTKKKSDSLQDVVLHYLKQHYNKPAVKWAKKANWTFDPDFDIDKMVLMRKPADVSDKHVAEIKQNYKGGRTVAPVVLVKTAQGYKVADGNHRVTALMQMGVKEFPAYVADGVGDFGPWDTMMQDDSMKKSSSPEITKSSMLYKSIDPDIIKTLQVGDVIVDDEDVEFSTERPTGSVAVVKGLISNRLPAGTELTVVDITPYEVVLESL